MPDDPRREGEGGRGARTTAGSSGRDESGTSRDSSKTHGKERDAGATEGTNRDFDESGESKNQGHGPPREERASSR